VPESRKLVGWIRQRHVDHPIGGRTIVLIRLAKPRVGGTS
jgi:hypothetical protein